MNRLVPVLLAALGLSFVASFFAAIFARQPVPGFVEVAFGVFPFLAFAVVLALFALVAAGKERAIQISAYVMMLTGVSCLVGFLASLTHVWNDGSYYTLLTPAWSALSVASLGVFPVKMGPIVLVRFIPVVFALGIFVRLRRSATWGRALAVSLGSYLILALSIHTLTWIGGAFSMLHNDALESPGDTFRVLVTAQADGYWTRSLADRFFASPGRQSDVSFLGIHAAVEFLLVFFACLWFGIASTRSSPQLLRRVLSRESLMLLAAPLVGLVAGFVLHPLLTFSYSDVLALVVFVIVIACWLMWWRITRDVANLADDERERPHLPLPSGAVSVNDAEALAAAAIALALGGAFILGWPVLLAFVTATSVPYLLAWMEFSSERRRLAGDAVSTVLIAGSLGVAALSVVLRDAVAAQWMFQMVFAAAFLIGIEQFLRKSLHTVPSRAMQAAAISGAALFSLILANKQATWLLFLPVIAAVFILARSDEQWRKFRMVPLQIVLGGLILVILFAAQRLQAS